MIHATITGTVTSAAQLMGDAAFCVFTVTSRSKNREGEKIAPVVCRLWGKRAATLAGYLVTGKRVAVGGTLDLATGRDGRPALECRVSEVDFMGGGERAADRAPAHVRPAHGEQPRQPEQKPSREASDYGGASDDEIPF
jgi:single-stranded DNA-binding protein